MDSATKTASDVLAVQSAMKPGEATSEHTAMVNAESSGKQMSMIGVALAVVPQILEGILQYASALPPELAQNKTIQIILAVMGGLLVIVGQIKAIYAKITFMTGRTEIKTALLSPSPILNTVEKKATQMPLIIQAEKESSPPSEPVSEPSSPPSPPPS